MDRLRGCLADFWEMLQDAFPDLLRSWSEPALKHMRLGPSASQDNSLMLQAFTWESEHESKSWWKHIEDEVPALAEMGFTQLWLPPPIKAMRPQGQGYDAYDLWDLGEFDQKRTIPTRWGKKEELLAASATAKSHGIDILIDAVLNHKLGADRSESCQAVSVSPTDRMKEIGSSQEIEVWTVFDFTGRNGQYSNMKWNEEHFTGVDYDARSKTNGIFRFTGGNHRGWSRWVDKENGNYDYLLGVDIDHRHPDVRQDLFAWGEWILQTTGARGFRLDAIKHMDRRFLREFLTKARALSNHSQLFAVAEYWSDNLTLIKPYIKTFEGLTSFFDVPLHYNFHRVSEKGADFDLTTLYNDTIVSIRPDDAVTFVDNHDTQIGQSLESWVSSRFKLQAYALILLHGDGHPCVFYGDLYPNKECYDEEIASVLKSLIRLRKTHAYGQTVDYPASRNCIGFVRTGDNIHPSSGCVVLVSNADTSADDHVIVMNTGPGMYRNVLDEHSHPVRVDSSGSGVFACPAGGLAVWVIESRL